MDDYSVEVSLTFLARSNTVHGTIRPVDLILLIQLKYYTPLTTNSAVFLAEAYM